MSLNMPCANCRKEETEVESSDFGTEFAEINFKCAACGNKTKVIYKFFKLEMLTPEGNVLNWRAKTWLSCQIIS
jgi:uncharacterized Zn finger protein